MTDDKVGYGKPPKHSRFKPGQSGNPKGRPKMAATPLAERINKVLDTPMPYREQGQVKVATRRVLSLKMLVDRAAKGDIAAADTILKIRQAAERAGGDGSRVIEVENWLPDREGQTAEEKSKSLRGGRHVEPGPTPQTSKK
jgi:hypothetical protein